MLSHRSISTVVDYRGTTPTVYVIGISDDEGVPPAPAVLHAQPMRTVNEPLYIFLAGRKREVMCWGGEWGVGTGAHLRRRMRRNRATHMRRMRGCRASEPLLSFWCLRRAFSYPYVMHIHM